MIHIKNISLYQNKDVISGESSSEKSFNLFKMRFLPSVEKTSDYSHFIFMKIQYAIFILFLATFPLSIVSCRCPSDEDIKIPISVIEKSNQQIISKTGEEFFHNNFSLNMADSKELKDKYLMKYNFKMDGKPYINKEISFMVDSLGSLPAGQNISGIPNCINGNCDFSVDASKAKQIAEEQGLEKGIKDWKADFVWNDKYENYVWKVISTSSESQGTNGYRGSGNEMIIDANNGKVLESNSWYVR